MRAIEKCHGITTAICAELDCSRIQWVRYVRRRPAVKAVVEKARESMIDLAENRLAQLVQSQDEETALKAAEFILRRIGSGRGWGDVKIAQEIKTGDGVSIRQIFGISEEDGE